MAFNFTLERVAADARQIRFGRVLLGAVTVPFYVLGWLVARLLLLLWLVSSHMAAAARVGYRDAMRGGGGPTR